MHEQPEFDGLAAMLDNLRPYSAEWNQRMKDILGATACQILGFYEVPADLVLSVVIPVYNERETLQALVERVRAVPIRKQIILVDDCSTDGTRDLLAEYAHRLAEPVAAAASGGSEAGSFRHVDGGSEAGSFRHVDDDNTLRVLYHEKNRGKGAALRTGFAEATGDIVLVQDADLEYDPAEYPRLIKPIVEDKADVVYGSRFLGDQPHRVLYYWHYVANKLLTMLSNLFTNLNLTDMETCYKVFRREVLQAVLPKLRQDRFGIEPEITARIARQRCRIYEMSISYSGRTYEQGKKIGWRDGFKALYCIVRYGLFR
jgi:glycosyltransferase involved in cell wall biosynthesis